MIFKKKDSEEIKEALQKIIKNLKEKGYEQEWKELQHKRTEITDKTKEIYQKIKDLTEIRDEILDIISKKQDKTQENLEAVEELKRIILEYDLPEPYKILAKEELSEGIEITLRPPFKVEPIKRPELEELVSKNQNVFVIGKPGIGKNLLLYRMSERLHSEKIVWIKSHSSEADANRLLSEDLLGKVLLVWDDVQNSADIFHRTLLKLKDKFGDFRVICAARSTELEKIEEIPVSLWEDLGFLQKEIPLFRIEERRELIERCSKKTGIEIADDIGRSK